MQCDLARENTAALMRPTSDEPLPLPLPACSRWPCGLTLCHMRMISSSPTSNKKVKNAPSPSEGARTPRTSHVHRLRLYGEDGREVLAAAGRLGQLEEEVVGVQGGGGREV